MRKIVLLVTAIVLATFAMVTPMAAHAGTGVSCWADSYELAQGEGTGIYCSGFTPLKYINVYLVEPDGTAAYYDDVKADASGNVAFGYSNGVKGEYSNLLGTYTFVVQELGLAKEIVAHGTVKITNSGAGEHMSGAHLHASQTTYDLTSDDIMLHGWGFAPNEIVTLWIQKPALCSSYTQHYVDGKNGATFENMPEFDFEGVYQVDDIKADGNGEFMTQRFFALIACHGTWRYGARGNTSGLGAYTEITLTGPSVSTDAWLHPSKDMVGAFNDTIQFHASGFGAYEVLNCWTTSPEGRAQQFGIFNSLGQIKMDADGTGVISMTTGSHIISPDDPYYAGIGMEPLMSEGSPGTWKLTCRGSVTGATAIAEYTVYGYATAP